MASELSPLGSHSGKNLVDISQKRFAIVVSEWNDHITEALFSGAVESLIRNGSKSENISRHDVPGSFELPLGAQWMVQKEEIDAVICIGCVIHGETPHFDYICNAVSQGIKDVSLKYSKPVVFGVLTTNTVKQAMDRAGGKHGNKGEEAAITAIKMLGFSHS